LTNFVAGTLGTFSFVFLLYAGYLYVTAAQNEENAEKAKKIIASALVGIVIALSAFAITSTFATLDASR
jgi:Type IV secretion system pilin